MDKAEIDGDFQRALRDPGIPHIYVNGFSNGLGNSDVTVVFKSNGVPTAVVNMSYTLAKTLSTKLGEMMLAFEESVDTVLLTTDDVEKRMAKEISENE